MVNIYEGFRGAEHAFGEFEVAPEDREGVTIVRAEYELEGYEGSAHVVFVRGGKLYKVNGSHCSCNGLEGQWLATVVPELFARSRVLQ